MSPKVSVLMPVYNGEKYLREAIDSVLGQTFRDFEFVIIDDGSVDDSAAIVESYDDPRICLVRNGRNLGLVLTLNKGLDLCRGDYIARMDCDDIAASSRLDRQVEFMDANPEVGVCGSWYERFGKAGRIFAPPCADGDIRLALTFENTFGHNTVMLRGEFLDRFHLRYDPSFPHAEDYEFWVRCSRLMKLANLPELLVRYRFHPENTSSVHAERQRQTADRVREILLADLGISPSLEELRLHHAITHHRFDGDYRELQRAHDWLQKFSDTLAAHFSRPGRHVEKWLSVHWYITCGLTAGEGLRVWRLFVGSPIGRAAHPVFQGKLLVRCLLRKPIPRLVLNAALPAAEGAPPS